MKTILKANNKLRRAMGEEGYDFLLHGVLALNRILPHTESSEWKICPHRPARASWVDATRKSIALTLSFEGGSIAKSLVGVVNRRSAETDTPTQRTLDEWEYDICNRIAVRLSSVISLNRDSRNIESLSALRAVFDEQIVSDHLKAAHKLEMNVGEIFASLHSLAQQSYENKAITFGCVLDPKRFVTNQGRQTFPRQYLAEKRFKALSDGFRTAYYVSCDGHMMRFADLEIEAKGSELTKKHIYPEWSRLLAHVTQDGLIGISLSRQGDILVFYNGMLRFTYRFGQWQYWNHRHLLDLLKTQVDGKRTDKGRLNAVVTRVYRTAIEVSFRRSGGLLIVLTDPLKLRQLVRAGDAIGDSRRSPASQSFDATIKNRRITSMPQSIVNELAALDGAIVLDRSGKLLAYGAVLRSSINSHDAEGSRTKAAIAASRLGLAVKISSDGDITAYFNRKEYFRV